MPGYSSTPLVNKLGIKEGCRLAAVGAPEDYRALLHPAPAGIRLMQRAGQTTDLVHHFSVNRAELARALKRYRQVLPPAATVWISWPKKASRVETDITEDVVRALALPLGFVDVKVCAVTDVWSGLKLVVRKELR